MSVRNQALEESRMELEASRMELEASLAESRQRLDLFDDILCINPEDVRLTDVKLGSGSYADVCIGHWNGKQVAVKRFHELITTERTIPMFHHEVLLSSRLHHPNIMTVCGAVMRPGLPFQMVMESLEGSVSELIDAAHASGTYLTDYEQLSVAVDITSAILYLHQVRPRPYVHGDIRPTNALILRDMTVKLGDLGATHLLESSLSAGPMSPQYLAPERIPPNCNRSSLSSDVYSLGVTVLEILTGICPIPEERHSQLSHLASRHSLFILCSRMIERDPASRPAAKECFDALKAEFEALPSKIGKRLVKGKFRTESGYVRHYVSLSEAFF